MAKKLSRLSLFSQPLDRAAAVAYFLGAVVPLGALAWVVLRWVQPNSAAAHANWFIALLGSIGALSLVSFFALRRAARIVIALLDRENRSLAQLVTSSRGLAAATEEHEVLALAAETAADVTGAPAGYLLARNRAGELQVREQSAGAIDLPGRGAALVSVAEAALVALKTMARVVPADGGGGEVIAVPCSTGPRMSGVIAVWHPDEDAVGAAERDALATLGSLVTIALRNADLREAERNFFTHATNLLVATLDLYLSDRSDHSRRVAGLANQVGHALSLPDSRRERMHFAALLHDIGMLRVPREHVADLNEVRRHAEFGDEMLRPIRVWEDLAPLVRHHHEWWDGRGYPDGLAGEHIPLESRIIAVAEAFDSMTAEKSYKRAIPIEEALMRLQAGAGTQFDPAVVRTFVDLQREPSTV